MTSELPRTMPPIQVLIGPQGPPTSASAAVHESAPTGSQRPDLVRPYLSDKPLRSSIRPGSSHLAFLRRVAAEGVIESATAETARRVWEQAWRAARRTIRGPAAGVGEDGEVVCTWDRGAHHLEVEIRGTSADWFYKNRQTRETGTWETQASDPDLPADLIQRIRLLA